MKKNNLVYILMLIMPIVDLLSSIITRNFTNSITIGIVIKTALIMISFIYVFFFSHSKYKKKSIIYYILLIAYVLLYFLLSSSITLTFSF